MKRAFGFGLLAVVVLCGIVAVYFIYNPTADTHWSLMNWSGRFPSHEAFVRLATTVRDSTCTRLLTPPEHSAHRVVFAWDSEHPWTPQPDSINHLPVRKLAPHVNRSLVSFTSSSVRDTFLTFHLQNDPLPYILYVRKDDSRPYPIVNAALMRPLDLYFKYGQASFAVTENTVIGQSWLGWSGSGQVVRRNVWPTSHPRIQPENLKCG